MLISISITPQKSSDCTGLAVTRPRLFFSLPSPETASTLLSFLPLGFAEHFPLTFPFISPSWSLTEAFGILIIFFFLASSVTFPPAGSYGTVTDFSRSSTIDHRKIAPVQLDNLSIFASALHTELAIRYCCLFSLVVGDSTNWNWEPSLTDARPELATSRVHRFSPR